jgi:glycosylphosphatidylinositol transamidase (GPIT) subunit GPI8
MYNLLKSNGVEDDKIILLLIDDIAHHEKNRMKGDVHHTVGGNNLREDAVIDYSGMEVAFEFEVVNVENLKNVLLGNKTADTPDVLETNENSNIFIYIVNHGGPGYIPFSEGGELTAEEFREIIEEMYKNKKYRQMFILIEVCFGESMALDIETPGVVFLIGASKNEPSFGANYDSEINAWLADDFTYQFLKIVSKEKNISIADLYTNVYERVAGSHVRLKNYDNFGDILTTPISEFIYP